MTAADIGLEPTLAQWPTVAECTGCVQCNALFRTSDNGRCRHCGSESVFDVAAILAGAVLEAQQRAYDDNREDEPEGVAV